ncbi:MAG: hypothetical protein K9N46_09445 [Candidatus Marinimicrobia bacterium]|nr:hypothetical protein [Candidatus Neomarinimicrobiota bacterium]MCF7828458.1 hypothetical protein [Candidatus Neomarinimicrobiota bacterium]MCF7880948.1 hypothetical protein [Candidatus Neomarinimicrobiota bacterium]
MKQLNRISLYISLLCIVIATTISILAIWRVVIDTEFVWKSLMTLGVIFLASLLTYTVNNLIPYEKRQDTPPSKDE